jgi:hypothetical protein
MANLDSTSEKVHDALSRIIREEGANMVTKWVCLVEVINDDGGPSLWSLTSDNLTMWDRIGLIEFHSRGIQPQVEREE